MYFCSAIVEPCLWRFRNANPGGNLFMQDRTPYRSNRRWSHLSAPLLFTAFALPLLYGSYQAQQKEKSARKLLPIARRALALCPAFSDTCHITGTPILLDERLPRSGATWKIRPLWSVE